MYYVYVIESKNSRKLYIGCTLNLKRRLSEHNQGLSPSTRPYLPYKLIYCEIFLRRDNAFQREKIMKGRWGKRFLERVLKNYFNFRNYTAKPIHTDGFTRAVSKKLPRGRSSVG